MHYHVIRKYISSFYIRRKWNSAIIWLFLHGTEPNIGRMFASWFLKVDFSLWKPYLWIHHQTIHVCMFCGQQFTSLLFLRLLSEPCQTSMNARFVLTRLCWLFNKGYQAVTSLTWPCSDIIYRFNYFLGQFKHQCIHKTSVTTQRVFSPPLRGSPPPPTSHPYVFTCGTDEKNYLKWRAIQLTSHQTEHQLNYLV